MKSLFRTTLLCAAILVAPLALFSQAKPDTIPKGEVSTTNQTVRIDGKVINYKAMAGTLLLRNNDDEPIALHGFTAYIKEGVTDPKTRPISFVFNGGPGSSSIWLHMGVIGPKRAVVNDPGFTPTAPYTLEDNNASILDVSDIVMMDPIGTGLSHAVGKAENKDFWGVDQDIKMISQFIRQFVTEQDRWNSPKFLIGESYGTFRNAGVVNYLQENMGMSMNGVIMVSAVFDLRTLVFAQGDDISYVMNLPTYAAVAWYHNKIPNKPASLEAFVQQAREFAKGEYTTALMEGDGLTGEAREKIKERLSYFTGLGKDYLEKADLRVSEPEFTEELLRDEHKTVGRLDARYTGINQDPLSQYSAYDPQSAAISPAYTALFMDYFYNTLKVNKANTYYTSAYGRKGFNWDWKHAMNGGGFPTPPNTGPDMAQALSRNPYLKIMILNGYYDLATPFYGVEYSIDHLGLEKDIKKNIIMKYYEGGHMMYTHKPSLEKFKKETAGFIVQMSKH
ncbi:MAG TPA: carboxypeptidase [Cyclobacteriaceae bacterium]|nr:carboxypeptidase [Cyclobacteriaceae bacterium]